MRKPDRAQDAATGADNGARLMLIALCCVWGVTWPLLRIALEGLPPFTMRTFSTLAGGLTLFAICFVMHRDLRIPGLKGWVHVVVASFLNIVSFTIFSAFAQLGTDTSRVAIVAYTMPIWAVILSWIFLAERPSGMQPAAIGLCTAGLAVLIYPLAAAGIPPGILLSLATGVSWAAGTVYLKWAQLDADPMAVAVWQVAVAFLVLAPCMLIVDGGPDFRDAHTGNVVATVAAGVLGTGVAYGLWFSIIRRLPAITASLGVLGSPVIGVVASVLILGEHPTATDIVGFALILVASACVVFARPAPARTSPADAQDKRTL